MPRLHVWAAGAAASLTTGYVVYTCAYAPYVLDVRQPLYEHALVTSRLRLQEVHKAMAQLCETVSDDGADSSSSSGSSSTDRRSRHARACNGDMLDVFCRVQRQRQALYALAAQHAQGAHDEAQMLQQLSRMQSSYCDMLHFRHTPPTAWQTLCCAACYVVYVLTFRALPALLRVCSHSHRRDDAHAHDDDDVDMWQRRLRHAVARQLVRVLAIDCTLCDSSNSASVQDNALDDNALDDNALDDAMATRRLVLCAQHWVEEVAFWACDNNPCLLSTSCTYTMCVQRGVCYDAHWRSVAAQQRARDAAAMTRLLQRDAVQRRGNGLHAEHAAAAAAAVAAGDDAGGDACDELYGYPRAPDVTALSPQQQQQHDNNNDDDSDDRRWCAVASAGLCDVLYIDGAARDDDSDNAYSTRSASSSLSPAHSPQLRRDDAQYKALLQHLYRHHTPRTQQAQEHEQQQHDDAKALRARTWLRAVRECGHVPATSRVWWGGVYGGDTCSNNSHSNNNNKSRRRARMCFVVDAPCRASELADRMSRATQRAVHAATTP